MLPARWTFDVNVWLEAARPRTLPAAVAPVLVGTAVAASFDGGRFVGALVVALSLQVAVNYANDYADGVRGVDTPDRVGPRRAVGSGLVAAGEMRHAVVVAVAIAAGTGLWLASVAGWELVLVGGLAVLAALGYSGGTRPYASLGLGEVSVFVFFGLVATVGSQYVQDEQWSWAAVVAAVPVGLIATAILVVNNLRDIPTDRAAGKRTLAVRLGDRGTRRLFVALVVGAFVMVLPVVLATGAGWAALALLAAPLAWRAVGPVRHAPPGPRLVRALEATGRLSLVFGALLAVGLALDRLLS